MRLQSARYSSPDGSFTGSVPPQAVIAHDSSTPSTTNSSVEGCVAPSDSRPIFTSAPAAVATRPSPVASTTTFARIVRRPFGVSTVRPATRRPSICASITGAQRSTVTPASAHSRARIPFASSWSMCSSGPFRVITFGASRWFAFRRRRTSSAIVPGHTLPRMGETCPSVRLPPRQPKRSTRIVFAPRRAALTAAHTPAGPPPATTTSASSHGAATRSPRRDAPPVQHPPAAANAVTALPDRNFLRHTFIFVFLLWRAAILAAVAQERDPPAWGAAILAAATV